MVPQLAPAWEIGVAPSICKDPARHVDARREIGRIENGCERIRGVPSGDPVGGRVENVNAAVSALSGPADAAIPASDAVIYREYYLDLTRCARTLRKRFSF
jgi:hypothetical protein